MLIDKFKLHKISHKIKYNNVFRVERSSRGGGLAVFWASTCNISILSYLVHHVDMKVEGL